MFICFGGWFDNRILYDNCFLARGDKCNLSGKVVRSWIRIIRRFRWLWIRCMVRCDLLVIYSMGMSRRDLPAGLFRSLPGFIRWKNCLLFWNNAGARRRRILPVRRNGFRRIRLLASVRLPLCWCMICLAALFIRFVEMVEEHTILTG